MKPQRLSKYYYFKFMRQRGNPQSLAVATAIGVFVGCTPTMPLHTITLVVLCLLSRTSFVTAFLASTLACNPLTYIPIYYLSTVIGNMITPYELTWPRIQEVLTVLLSHPGLSKSLEVLMGLGYEATIVLLAGGVVLALPFTIASYVLSYRFFLKIRQKRREKHILN